MITVWRWVYGLLLKRTSEIDATRDIQGVRRSRGVQRNDPSGTEQDLAKGCRLQVVGLGLRQTE
jgi:hypothetical protein